MKLCFKGKRSISLVSNEIFRGKAQNKTAAHAKQVILKKLCFSQLDFKFRFILQIYAE